MRCPSCEFENPVEMQFCGRCGSPLANLCPHCDFENPQGFAFCGRCGESLAELEDAPTAALTCPQCGKSISSDAKFCLECGTPVADAQSASNGKFQVWHLNQVGYGERRLMLKEQV